MKLFDIESLKGKRGLTKSLFAQLRQRYNVSISEVEHQDSRRYLGVGISAVSSSRAVIDSMFMRILEVLQSDRRFEVEEYEQTFV